MSTDEENGRVIGGRLRDEVADIHAARDLAGAVRERRRTQQRAWTIRASIGAPLAAAAAVAVVLTSGATPTEPRGGTHAAPPTSKSAGATTQVRVENVAHVQAMTIQALRSAENYVIYEKQMLRHGYDECWTDRATDRYRLDAYTTVIQSDEELAPGQDGTVTVPAKPAEPPTGPLRRTHSVAGDGPAGDIHYIHVDYDRKTWSTSHSTEKPPPSEVPDVLDADALKKAIDEGRMELIGTETIGDKETHHLRLFATIRGYQIDLWVDATSYLPVRQTSTILDGPKEPVLTSDYDWLPRDEKNLAKLELIPPPDFVKE